MRYYWFTFVIILVVPILCYSSSGDDLTSEPAETVRLLPLYELSRNDLVAEARSHLEATGRKSQGYAVGIMPSLSRLFRDGGPPPRWTGPIEISIARGELEHREIMLLALDGQLENVQVLSSDFTHESASATLQVTVGPVGFVRTPRRPEPHPQVHVGDVLLPAQTFDVRSDELQAVYLLVESSAETPAGLYEGQITVQPQGKKPTVLQTRLRVWDFVLPKQPPLHGWMAGPDDVLLKHKLEPGWWDPPFDLSEPITQQQWQQVEQRIVRWFAQGHSFLMIRTPGAPLHGSVLGSNGNNPMPEYSPEQIQAMISYWRGTAEILDRLNLLDRAAIYVWDEPHYEKFEQMTTLCDWVHQAHPRLKTCSAGWWDLRAYRDNGTIDVYCPITFSFDPALDRSGRPYGTETWWYICWVPPTPAPNVMVDNPPLQQRIIGWQSWRFGVTGFIYWETHLAMWKNLTQHQPPFTDCGEMKNGGDGTLIYRVNGQYVPSLRLRHLGDGMEDLQYIQLLETLMAKMDRQQSLQPASETYLRTRQAAKMALGQVANLVSERQEAYSRSRIEGHTSDPVRLLSARANLAQAILQIKTFIKRSTTR